MTQLHAANVNNLTCILEGFLWLQNCL